MIRKLALVLLFASACGDNLHPEALVDASVDASSRPPLRAVVVTPSANFAAGQPGVLSVVAMADRTVMPNVGPAMAIGNDPVLRRHGSELFVVNRGTNNVTILDAADFSLTEQLGTGAGTNPQDVAIVDDKLFVATFGGKGLVELRRGFSVPTEIDLSADDPDGEPNCNSIHRVGNRLFVACELLDGNFAPRGPGKVYVVDPGTRAITHTVTLVNANPINLLEQIPPNAPDAGDLVIGTIDFATGLGCLERITVGATPASAGCIETNATFGGYVARVGYFAPEFTGPVAGIVIPPMMWAVIGKPDFSTALHTYDPVAQTLSPAVSSATHVPLDLAVCETGEIVVSDAPFGTSGGLRVFHGPMEITTMPLPVGLSPASIAGLVCY